MVTIKKEKVGKIFFISFIVVSIITGFIPFLRTADPCDYDISDSFYFLGEQLSELLLLLTIYTGYRPTKKWLYGVIALCAAEMWDEVFGKNLSFNIYDFVLIGMVVMLILTCYHKDHEKIDDE